MGRDLKDRSRISKRLSWLLRHGAGEVSLVMDAAGWVAIDDVLRQQGIDRTTLDEVVAVNQKNRLQIDGARIRACQGHSFDNMPVTQAALESTWLRLMPPSTDIRCEWRVWHGTSLHALDGIAQQGILRGGRTHVHLAAAPDSTVGKRHQVDALLAIDGHRMHRANQPLWEAPNGVILARYVPPSCIDGAIAISRAAKRKATETETTRIAWLPKEAPSPGR